MMRSERIIRAANARRPVGKPSAWTFSVLLSGALLAVLIAGCGQQTDGQKSGAGMSAEPAAAAAVPLGQTPSLAADAPAEAARGAEGEGSAVAADSLAPDVSASIADTIGVPGGTVEVTARTSPDVNSVILWDGIGQKQAFTFDQEAKVWRLSYRVPLKSPWERLGLSVRGANEAGRWRRVWVFLNIQPPAPEVPPQTPDHEE